MKNIDIVQEVPFVCLYDQLDRAFSTLQVGNMKSVQQEDDKPNNDYSVDPLADPRLDKMDLFNLVDAEDRDAIMNAQESYSSGDGDLFQEAQISSNESSSDSGSGE